jgi:hypothetical protein
MENGTIFCNTCVFHMYEKNLEHECLASSEYQINFYQKTPVYKKCSEVNKNNDCKLYEKKFLTGLNLNIFIGLVFVVIVLIAYLVR